MIFAKKWNVWNFFKSAATINLVFEIRHSLPVEGCYENNKLVYIHVSFLSILINTNPFRFPGWFTKMLFGSIDIWVRDLKIYTDMIDHRLAEGSQYILGSVLLSTKNYKLKVK